MPEIGEEQLRLTECSQCGKEYWGKRSWENLCWLCWNVPGRKRVSKGGKMKGCVWVKLAEDDPMYPMTVFLGVLGKGWIQENRLVVARKLGRCLESDERVWRKNKDRSDNRIENLQLRDWHNHIIQSWDSN